MSIQSAHLILLNICSTCQIIGLGIYTAIAFPLGRTLGRGSFENAKKISRVAFIFSLILGILVSLPLFICRDIVAAF